MAVLLKNNASSTLLASISDSATTVTIQSADAAEYPDPEASDWFPLTVVDSAGNMEIMRVTARAGNDLTVTRAQEGTTAKVFDAGARAELRLTIGALDEFARVSDIPDVSDMLVTGNIGTAANIRARAEGKLLSASVLPDAKAPVPLAYAATRSLVWTDGWYRTCTLSGNMTLSNPTSVEPGDAIVLRLFSNDATERSISWGSNYVGPLPDATVTSMKGLLVTLIAVSDTAIDVTWKVLEL